jgi:RNA polymerase sigma-70 factor, ECF subfamily
VVDEKKLTREGVRKLYEQHAPALLLYARSFVPDGAAAEDALHQVFAKLLRGETTVPDAPLAYLYRAVRNAALNARRSRAKDVGLDSQEAWFQHWVDGQESTVALQCAIRELPEEQREAVILRIWAGMTFEEMAESTSVPVNTVASRYRYGLEKLRDRLKPWRRTEKELGDE